MEGECPRVLTREKMVRLLRNGVTIFVDRIDAPELQDLQELERLGLVVNVLWVRGDQYSVAKFRWKEFNMRTTILTMRGGRVPDDVLQSIELAPHLRDQEMMRELQCTIEEQMLAHPDFVEIRVVIERSAGDVAPAERTRLPATVSDFLLGVEYGVRAAERGSNLQAAMRDATRHALAMKVDDLSTAEGERE